MFQREKPPRVRIELTTHDLKAAGITTQRYGDAGALGILRN